MAQDGVAGSKLVLHSEDLWCVLSKVRSTIAGGFSCWLVFMYPGTYSSDAPLHGTTCLSLLNRLSNLFILFIYFSNSLILISLLLFCFLNISLLLVSSIVLVW